jgi:hypothetical protein
LTFPQRSKNDDTLLFKSRIIPLNRFIVLKDKIENYGFLRMRITNSEKVLKHYKKNEIFINESTDSD